MLASTISESDEDGQMSVFLTKILLQKLICNFVYLRN